MSRLRLDIVSILAIALAVAVAILFWGEQAGIGIDTTQAKSLWLSGLAVGTLAVVWLLSFGRLVGWSEAKRRLRKLLTQWQVGSADATQASLTRANTGPKQAEDLVTLRAALRQRHGIWWRYRQPWMLLVGDDAAIAPLFAKADGKRWLLSADVVLLWATTDKDGLLGSAWLKQIARMRRQRPVDAVVHVTRHEAGASEVGGAVALAGPLAQLTRQWHWSAPVFALELAAPPASVSGLPAGPVVACDVPQDADAAGIEATLLALRDQLSIRSLAQFPQTARERYLGELSQRLDDGSRLLAERWADVARVMRSRLPVCGMVFTPTLSMENAAGAHPVWQYLSEAAQRAPGRRTLSHPLTICTGLALTVTILWTAGMLVSAFWNSHEIRMARQAADAIQSPVDGVARLKALDALQQQVQRYEYRVGHGAPLFSRFGLNRDAVLLASLWGPYARASREMLVMPVVSAIEAQLTDLSRLPTDQLDGDTGAWAIAGRDALTAYLMLAHPERVEVELLAQQTALHWSTDARVTPGQKADMAERFARFYAERLKSHPEWKIDANPELVAGARQTLLAAIGQRNAIDTIYRNLLDGVGSKYADQSLASLTAGTDPRGLIRSSGTVAGVFTRQAYEGYVEAAIEKAARRQDVVADWVLADDQAQHDASASGESPDSLREALAERYFADYAEHWQQFANSLQWEPAGTLPAVVDQLKLMADARQSPVIALMKSMVYQSGAGTRRRSLSDTLMAKAQNLMGGKDGEPEVAQPDAAGPLDAAFGPVVRLMGPSAQTGAVDGGLSLQRYLDRITVVRLRLQQMINSPDADVQARQIALAVFKGKDSDLADTQGYAYLLAASVGAEWAGMGDALFVRPITLAMQGVLQPAQASLNDAWRQAIATPWNQAFAGRYPFAETVNDASVAELARFVRPRIGLIDTFLQAQLAGVLEQQGDRWVPAANRHGLAFDPEFQATLNTLQRIGAHLLTQGEARYRFELKPVPVPGLTSTLLRLDGQTLHYYNQQETWQTMTWPADNLQSPGTLLQWQTEKAGTDANLEFGGRWGLVRMLERARIDALDSATFQLTWQAASGTGIAGTERRDPDALTPRAAGMPLPGGMAYPIRYQMRAEVGRGPIELLDLRGLRMPERIFAVTTVAGRKE